MATSVEIADRALELARGFLDRSRAEMVSMAGEDGKELYDAAQIVRTRANSGGHTTHSAEHLAFSLIMAANEQLRQRSPVPKTRSQP